MSRFLDIVLFYFPGWSHFYQLSKLPSHLECLQAGDPEGDFQIMYDDENSFQYSLICPSSGMYLWKHSRRLLYFPGISVVLSDKDKGGEAAIKSENLHLSVCLKHIEKKQVLCSK